ncbi:hypothetical protein M407DRAFT_28750 [Tulasnella calospora MUT 4182]|uniref:NAD(P)-binding protein n=1 Tax=Tulasnella calospora MUT 4182 TaxID=1051891 RepID=A0A0C3QBF5_9AGAM|nr:hypothetical protein M407DRAFT_28750 [Tulasnella calospora MUT 4182]
MPPLSDAKALNASYTSSYRPTALFVGGTSGCGQGTAEAFARATQGHAHILICGRNREAAEKIIAVFPKHAESKYEFVECDATLMKNVVKATEEIKHRISDAGGKSKLNYLVLSQGVMTMNPFDPTSEGIDRRLALNFYSRWKFVDELIPLMENASSDGEEARVMTILAPGIAGPLDTSDLGLKKNYSSAKASKQGPAYTDNFIAEYSSRYPAISFIHIFPGWVNTPLFKNLPWYLRLILTSFSSVMARSIPDCGEYMASALLNPAYKAGGFWLSSDGSPVLKEKLHVDDQDARKQLVEHYTKEVSV